MRPNADRPVNHHVAELHVHEFVAVPRETWTAVVSALLEYAPPEWAEQLESGHAPAGPAGGAAADLDERLCELVEAAAAQRSPIEALELFVELETLWWLATAGGIGGAIAGGMTGAGITATWKGRRR